MTTREVQEAVFQSTLPARGATWVEDFFQASNNISIHAPRTGSDDVLQGLIPNGGISIHAPRTGSDMVGMSLGSAVRHFNPRSPHGERLYRM